MQSVSPMPVTANETVMIALGDGLNELARRNTKVQPVPKTAMVAAVKLRDSIRTRPNKRHVRIETGVDGNGEFVYTLIASVDPSTGVAVLLSAIDGFPVRYEPWPTQ
jgi:hypothetical protein